jgi:hypothetical protein
MRGVGEMTPLSQNAPSKNRFFIFMDQEGRFRRDVLLYTGSIIEKGGGLARIRFAE